MQPLLQNNGSKPSRHPMSCLLKAVHEHKEPTIDLWQLLPETLDIIFTSQIDPDAMNPTKYNSYLPSQAFKIPDVPALIPCATRNPYKDYVLTGCNWAEYIDHAAGYLSTLSPNYIQPRAAEWEDYLEHLITRKATRYADDGFSQLLWYATSILEEPGFLGCIAGDNFEGLLRNCEILRSELLCIVVLHLKQQYKLYRQNAKAGQPNTATTRTRTITITSNTTSTRVLQSQLIFTEGEKPQLYIDLHLDIPNADMAAEKGSDAHQNWDQLLSWFCLRSPPTSVIPSSAANAKAHSNEEVVSTSLEVVEEKLSEATTVLASLEDMEKAHGVLSKPCQPSLSHFHSHSPESPQRAPATSSGDPVSL